MNVGLMVDAVIAAIAKAVDPLYRRQNDSDRRLAALEEREAEREKRIAELEARPTMEHKGTWTAGEQYRRGHCVTHSGSTWHCIESTSDRPGASAHWRLIVKKGSDGRDARA